MMEALHSQMDLYNVLIKKIGSYSIASIKGEKDLLTQSQDNTFLIHIHS